MRVLFRLGNAELLEALCRYYLAYGALKLFGRIGDGQRERLVVLRGADIAQGINGLFAHEAVKVGQIESPCHFPCTVGAEVHEYDAVALVYRTLRAYYDGLYELIGYVCRIAVLDGLYGIGVYLTLTADDSVVAGLDSVPALVSIHAVETTLYRCDLCIAERGAFIVQARDILHGASRRNVASVKEAVEIDLIKAALLCHVKDCEYVVYMAVHTAVGQKAEDVQGLAAVFRIVHCLDVGCVFKEAAVCYGIVYARQILKHDAPRADIRVADLAVAHLPLRQTDIKAGCLKARVGVFRENAVKAGLFRKAYGIASAVGRYAEAVHYNKNALTHSLSPLRQ